MRIVIVPEVSLLRCDCCNDQISADEIPQRIQLMNGTNYAYVDVCAACMGAAVRLLSPSGNVVDKVEDLPPAIERFRAHATAIERASWKGSQS